MKIAIISDIHGNLQALQAIVKDIEKENIDEIICLGDIIAIGPKSKECLGLIIDKNIHTVLGNHELYFLKGINIDDEMGENEIKHQEWIQKQLNERHKEYLKKCPLFIEKQYDGKRFLFEHFLLLENTNDEYPFEDIDILNNIKIKEIINDSKYEYFIIGHEHNSCEISLDNKRIICVGSSGCVKDENTFYTILSIDEEIEITKKVINYEREKLVLDLKEKDYPCRKNISKIFFGVNV